MNFMGSIVRGGDFAERLSQLCDNHPLCPPKFRGRQRWLTEQLQERFGIRVSHETVSKWFSGDAKPRRAKIAKLAELFQADAMWLELGIEMAGERRVLDSSDDGAVFLVAGFIRMDGGGTTAPDEPGAVDLYAVIRGARYPIHVTSADTDDKAGTHRFTVPVEHHDMVVIGVVRRPGRLAIDAIELTAELIEEYGATRGGAIEVLIPKGVFTKRKIRDFSQRL